MLYKDKPSSEIIGLTISSVVDKLAYKTNEELELAINVLSPKESFK